MNRHLRAYKKSFGVIWAGEDSAENERGQMGEDGAGEIEQGEPA